MKKYVSILLAILLMLSMGTSIAEIPAGSQGGNAIVVGGWLRVRSGPGYSYETVASLPVGTVVKVLQTTGEWAYVQLSDGSYGYMSRYYLNSTNLSPQQPITPSQPGQGGFNAYVYSANGGNVRLRSGPNYSYGVIGSYAYGTPLYVVTRGTNWDYIKIGEQFGYMNNAFIRTNINITPPHNNQGSIAYITSTNGLGVRLRSLPKYGATILGLYSVGTEVRILKHNVEKGWDYIEVAGRTGYMSNRFLTKNMPIFPNQQIYNIIDFTLSAYHAVPNQTVSVGSIVPNNATVTYAWKLNNTVIGTGKSLTIPAYALGKNITIEVRGYGNFYGSISKTIIVNNSPISPDEPLNVLTNVKLNKTTATVGDTVSVVSTTPSDAQVSYFWEIDGSIVSYSNSLTIPYGAQGKKAILTAQGTGNCTGTVYQSVEIVATAETPIPTAEPTPIPTEETPKFSVSFFAGPYTAGSIIAYQIDSTVFGTFKEIINQEWYKDGILVSTDASYIAKEEDVGSEIKVIVKFSDVNDNVYTMSKATKIQ